MSHYPEKEQAGHIPGIVSPVTSSPVVGGALCVINRCLWKPRLTETVSMWQLMLFTFRILWFLWALNHWFPNDILLKSHQHYTTCVWDTTEGSDIYYSCQQLRLLAGTLPVSFDITVNVNSHAIIQRQLPFHSVNNTTIKNKWNALYLLTYGQLMNNCISMLCLLFQKLSWQL